MQMMLRRAKWMCYWRHRRWGMRLTERIMFAVVAEQLQLHQRIVLAWQRGRRRHRKRGGRDEERTSSDAHSRLSEEAVVAIGITPSRDPKNEALTVRRRGGARAARAPRIHYSLGIPTGISISKANTCTVVEIL